jgi:hypothetical protein
MLEINRTGRDLNGANATTRRLFAYKDLSLTQPMLFYNIFLVIYYLHIIKNKGTVVKGYLTL